MKSDVPGEFNVIKNTTFVNEDSSKDVQTNGFSLTEGAGVSEKGLAEATLVYDPSQIKKFAIEMPTGEIKPVEQFHKKGGGKGKPSLGKLLIPVAAGFGAYQIVGLGQNDEVKGESTYLVVSNEVPAEQNFLTTTNNPNYYVSEFPLKHPQGGGEVFVSDSLKVAEKQLEEEKDKLKATDTEKKKDGIGYLNVEKKPPEDKTTRGSCNYEEEKKDGSSVCEFIVVTKDYKWVPHKVFSSDSDKEEDLNEKDVIIAEDLTWTNNIAQIYGYMITYSVIRKINGGLQVNIHITSLGEKRWIGNNIERENEIQKSFAHKSNMCINGKPPTATIDGNSVWYLKVKKLQGFENAKIDKLRIQFKTSHYLQSDAGLDKEQEKVVLGEANSPDWELSEVSATEGLSFKASTKEGIGIELGGSSTQTWRKIRGQKINNISEHAMISGVGKMEAYSKIKALNQIQLEFNLYGNVNHAIIELEIAQKEFDLAIKSDCHPHQ